MAENYDLDTVNGPYNMIKAMLDNVSKFAIENYSATNKSINIYFYAHNSGKFDTKIILKAIYTLHKEHSTDLPIHISDPHHDIYQVTIKYGRFNMIFRDSLKLLLASVENLNTQMLGGEFPKIPLNIEFIDSLFLKADLDTILTANRPDLVSQLYSFDSKGNPTPNPSQFAIYKSVKRYINAYCLNDCMVVAKSLIKISESIAQAIGFGIGIKDCITISSMAMYAFTRKFYNVKETPLMSIGLTSSASSFIRNAYIGGRVEVFHRGLDLGKVYHFDVPGMYALCITKDLPYGNPVFVRDFAERTNTKEFLRNLHSNNLIGFIKCEVETPKDLHIPVLGIKATSGKLTFPLGEILGT